MEVIKLKRIMISIFRKICISYYEPLIYWLKREAYAYNLSCIRIKSKSLKKKNIITSQILNIFEFYVSKLILSVR